MAPGRPKKPEEAPPVADRTPPLGVEELRALVEGGEIDTAAEGAAGTAAARAHHLRVREELPVRALALSKSDPAIPTGYVEAD